jgi:hypothetical protein
MATIVGYRPKDPSKALFRINDESWAVLARFIIDRCQNLLPSGEAEGWLMNKGHIVDEMTAQRVADRLERLLEQGIVKSHETELLIHYPLLVCPSCNSMGVNKKAEKCPVCNGEGRVSRVQFFEQKVREFVDFIKNCNGFDIY